jgi:cyclic beta-1,2-glucan synthetase
VHGLPLMGAGDWNDGMNRVGWQGKGESVWMAWFLKSTLEAFAPVAELQGREELADEWKALALELAVNTDAHAWDGDWYRRAYYDDGTPLGSAQSDECRIDSLAQSWAVIAGGGDAARAHRAMAAVNEHLVDRETDIVRLFTPAFDKTTHDPGYIKGYLPGIRENGGQYTHAGTWTVFAYARLKQPELAFDLFRMLNPIHKGDSRLGVQRYRIEPYVLAGDVYGEAPHKGRGGWSWYTGAAGWYWRAGIEEILGVKISEGVLNLVPCIPPAWPGFTVTLRRGAASYRIEVQNPQRIGFGRVTLSLDGQPVPGELRLDDDGADHHVVAVMQAGDGVTHTAIDPQTSTSA